jgi:hypothetical protein
VTARRSVPALLVLTLALGACSRAQPPPGSLALLAPPPAATAPGSASGTITAHPNPVPGHSDTTTITWSAPQLPSVVIRVSADGRPEQLFAQGPSQGSERAPFIVGARRYAFRLYAPADPHTAIAEVVVAHAAGNG